MFLVGLCGIVMCFSSLEDSYRLEPAKFDRQEVRDQNALWMEELEGSYPEEKDAPNSQVDGNPIGERFCFLLVSLKEQKPCGYLSYYILSKDQALLDSFFLQKSYRGQGLGMKALFLLEEQLKEKGVTSISLTVQEENKSALYLYQKAGFQVVRKGFESGHVIFLMSKNLKS
jgi:ribosomal protein S18 acetylase RimI-like enzyme